MNKTSGVIFKECDADSDGEECWVVLAERNKVKVSLKAVNLYPIQLDESATIYGLYKQRLIYLIDSLKRDMRFNFVTIELKLGTLKIGNSLDDTYSKAKKCEVVQEIRMLAPDSISWSNV